MVNFLTLKARRLVSAFTKHALSLHLVLLHGFDPCFHGYQPCALATRRQEENWYPFSESNTVLSVCRTDAVPSGARGVKFWCGWADSNRQRRPVLSGADIPILYTRRVWYPQEKSNLQTTAFEAVRFACLRMWANLVGTPRLEPGKRRFLKPLSVPVPLNATLP